MPTDAEQRAYGRGYQAGVKRGRRVAQVLHAQIAELRAALGAAKPTGQAVPAAGRAHMPIHLPGWSAPVDVYWPTDLEAGDLEMVRDQCVLVLDRWIKARKLLAALPDPSPTAGVQASDLDEETMGAIAVLKQHEVDVELTLPEALQKQLDDGEDLAPKGNTVTPLQALQAGNDAQAGKKKAA